MAKNWSLNFSYSVLSETVRWRRMDRGIPQVLEQPGKAAATWSQEL